MSGPRAWGTCETCPNPTTGERRFCGICLANRMTNYRTRRTRGTRHQFTCTRCGIQAHAAQPDTTCQDCKDAA